jgi:hypothetical protein
MLGKQLLVEIKRAVTLRNLLIWLAIIILVPAVRFYTIRNGYEFYEPIEVFQETVSSFIPLLFPALTIIIFLPSFLQEQRNNFIFYTRPRIPLTTYLLSKGLVNACLTGIVTFFLIFIPFLFIQYIEPSLGIIHYTPKDQNAVIPNYTFSQFLLHGTFLYGFIYSLWVAVNAIVYSTIALMLLLIVNNPFVALSIPFVCYHVFNFITGVLNIPMFSPLSTIFPFNIVQQPLWTVLVPFSTLVFILIGIFTFAFLNKKEWMI